MQSNKSTRSRRRVLGLVAGIAAFGIGATVTVQAQQGPPNRTAQNIKYRQALFTVMSKDWGWFNAMNRGQTPFDAAEAAKRAPRMDAVIGMLPEAFPEDSQGEGTKAKPEIWTDKAEFDRILQDFVARSGALAKAAAGGVEADIKTAAKAVGEVCGQCHQKFKNR